MKNSGLTSEEQARFWALRNQSLPLRKCARLLQKDEKLLSAHLRASGGVAPAPMKRPERQLTVIEREEISRDTAAGKSMRAIARRLGRSHTTVSREVARNGGRSAYRAGAAEEAAVNRRRRPKASKLSSSPGLRAEVERLLMRRWSPRQISARLRADHPHDPTMNISAEAIYLSLYVQTRNELRRELTRYLRQRRQIRQPKAHKVVGRGRLPDMVMISERPAEVEDRAVPGHWEGDMLRGTPFDGIGTLVERSTRYLMLFKLPARPTAEDFRLALTKKIQELPEHLRLTLTYDQGKEMSQHVKFSVDTGVKVYFCDPHHPWQRGSNENTNGLLRDYFPRGKSFRNVSQAQLDFVAHEVNGRPRETLGFRTPQEALAKLLAETTAAGGAVTP